MKITHRMTMPQAAGKKPNQKETNSREELFSCKQCDKKFPATNELKEHEMSHICDAYKKGTCKYGPRGKNSQGQCHFKHPRPCMYHETPTGCKKGNKCDFRKSMGA